MQPSAYPFVVITGATASGKTRLGICLAREFHGEIVNCDALQVYRGMDIGTAKASALERVSLPHFMIDLRDPCEDFSAGDYQRQCREVLSQVKARGRIPFLVGGTGFYLRALIHGLFEGPGRSTELRERMRRIAARKGSAYLHRALSRSDPESARRIMPTDLSRIIRAYEIYLLTGKPMSFWHRQPTDHLEGFRWLKLAIQWPRQELYERINTRVEEMFQQGFVEEVRGLLERYPRDCHAFKAIGYKQIAQYHEGKLSLEQAKEETQRESRRYAKRQLTWFRADPEIVWLDPNPDENNLLAQARGTVQTFLGS